ncbi:MAG TPA: DsbA family protein [Blastocatellia bacterium]|nr:DsbA family protein [Blastocatellia bacterium]
MNAKIVSQLVMLVALLSFGFSLAQAQSPVAADTAKAAKPIAAEQRTTIETVVREYLLNNPSILREVMQALQVKEEKERQARAAANLQAHQAELYADPDTPTAGNPKGDVTIAVFFDYNCGYCKKTLPGLSTLLAKDPSLKVVYKELPVLGTTSLLGARAALAAHKQGKYAAFHEALVQLPNITLEEIKTLAERLGLDYGRLVKDLEDAKTLESLERVARLATALEINGTPAYIVGEQLIPGAIDADALAQLVANERAKLAKAKAGVASAIAPR